MPVVLLHALARTRRSMLPLARRLERAGHATLTLDHPSTRATLHELAAGVLDAVERRGFALDESLSFVGHSLGGLVYRSLPLVRPGLRCGPSVTLGSPVLGSVVARELSRHAPFRALYGPAFVSLAPSAVEALPPFPGPTLCIAGTRAAPFVPAYWVLRWLGERRPSDSTVLVEEALHPEARAHARVDAMHTFLPSHPDVQRRILAFLAGEDAVDSEASPSILAGREVRLGGIDTHPGSAARRK